MTTIHTTDDFIEALTYNPAFKTAVLEALTPEDADAARIPALMESILEELREMRKTQADMQRTDEESQKTQTEMQKTQTEMQKTQTEMQRTDEESQRTQAEMQKTQAEMQKTQESIEASIGHLVGDNLERKMGYALPSELRTGYGVELMTVLVYPVREQVVTRDFLSELDEAQEKGDITEEERVRVIKTDMIIAEHDGNRMRTRFFVAEASNAVNNDDIDRAIQTTEILERIFSSPVVPIAFGHQASSAVRVYNSTKANRRVRIITLDR